MTATIPIVEASQPGQLMRATAQADAATAGFSHQITAQQANLLALQAAWSGAASAAAVNDARRTLVQLQRVHAALERVRSAMQGGAPQLTATRTALFSAVGTLCAQGWQVADDGLVSIKPRSMLALFAGVSLVNTVVLQRISVTASAKLKELLAEFDADDQKLEAEIRSALSGLGTVRYGRVGEPSKPPADNDIPPMPVQKEPEPVNRWWWSLTDGQRRHLKEYEPAKIGNTNGIPLADRGAANLRVLGHDIDKVNDIATSQHVAVENIEEHPERYDLTASDITRYRNAGKVQAGLDRAARESMKIPGDKGGRAKPPILLVKYEPEAFGGKGVAAIAIGNPDTAKNTSVTVSGMTTSVAAGTLRDGSGIRLFNEANRADWDNSTAVIQWMGYDAPNGAAVVEPTMARHGAQFLAADINALSATHLGADSHLTVIGHSYGSTTVADAAAGFGMRADDVVLIGCPGTDLAKSAADFHLPPDGHLYVGAASSDPVTKFGAEHVQLPLLGLGADPAMDGFGSTRFHAEVATPSWDPVVHPHIQYYEEGSESLFSMADIVSGHGDALEHDGMTANHRVQVLPRIPGLPHIPMPVGMTMPLGMPGSLPSTFDPEQFHLRSNNHHHQAPPGSDP